MFSFLHPCPCKSRLTDEEYKEYKLGFEEALQRSFAMDFPCPVIQFDDSCKHIVLRSFKGCIDKNSIVIPEGITIVYVSDDFENLLDDNLKYDLVLPDTCQSIDSLPEMHIHMLDTNKLESIRLRDSDYCSSKAIIEHVIVRDDYKVSSSIGHLKTEHLYYKLTKPYKVKKSDTFIHDEKLTVIHLNENCQSVKLNDRLAIVYMYGKEENCKGFRLKTRNSPVTYIDKSIDDVIKNIK